MGDRRPHRTEPVPERGACIAFGEEVAAQAADLGDAFGHELPQLHLLAAAIDRAAADLLIEGRSGIDLSGMAPERLMSPLDQNSRALA